MVDDKKIIVNEKRQGVNEGRMSFKPPKGDGKRVDFKNIKRASVEAKGGGYNKIELEFRQSYSSKVIKKALDECGLDWELVRMFYVKPVETMGSKEHPARFVGISMLKRIKKTAEVKAKKKVKTPKNTTGKKVVVFEDGRDKKTGKRVGKSYVMNGGDKKRKSRKLKWPKRKS